jgi:hypothetical protein
VIKGILFYIALTILLLSPDIFGEEIDTGNILTNSTFGTGTTYSTTGWTVDEHTHGHHGTGAFSSLGGGNNPGGSVAAEENTEIKQTIKLSEKTNMTTPEIQNGWSSTLSADIWYWNSYNNTTTLKQTITGSDGSTSTQQRVIEDTGCSGINCGQFTNYTDTHIQGTNTQTDFDIEVSVGNTNNRSGHWGPDIDDVQLKINYTYIPPIDSGTQTIIDDIDEDIVDIIEDLQEDFDWYNDEIVFEDEYIWEEEEYTWEDEYIVEDNFYFEEELDFEITEFDSPPIFEDFEEFDMEEMPTMEEVFFEEEFMEEPPMITEELFTEEFEEDFTSFIEETGMEEEFEQFLEEEGITAEEFFEEITEEEFSDELTEESFDEFEEPMEEVATNEESVPEVIEDKEEAMEEPTKTESIEEEKEVASNEQAETKTEEETESSSEGTDESEVSTEDGGEQEEIQSEGKGDVDTDTSVSKTVTKIENKLKQNLKKVAKQIAQATKQSTQNLSKEDLFFNNNNLNAYLKTDFYKSKDIYTNTNLDFFNQIDLGVYSKDIYTTISLNSYVSNDPVEVHNKKIQEINIKKRQLLAELEALKQ